MKLYKRVCPECAKEIVYSGYKTFHQATTRNSIKDCLDELYERIKHGDEEHQKWLKEEIEKFKLFL